ncbi:MAG: hypothetical protein ACREIV_05260, partial [Planctomycetaceae bacterium]
MGVAQAFYVALACEQTAVEPGRVGCVQKGLKPLLGGGHGVTVGDRGIDPRQLIARGPLQLLKLR